MSADRLLLWRHGQTASNAGGRFQGQLDVPLDDVGRVQVKDAAAVLARLVGRRSCRIVSSDLSRAHDTALALSECTGLPVETDRALREITVGSWEGLLHEDVVAVEPEAFRAWLAGDDVRPGGGERRSEAAARAERAIRAHADATDDEILVVASHGGVLRGAIQRLLGVEQWTTSLLAPLRNAHWAQLDRRRDRWVLGAYNVGVIEGATPPEN